MNVSRYVATLLTSEISVPHTICKLASALILDTAISYVTYKHMLFQYSLHKSPKFLAFYSGDTKTALKCNGTLNQPHWKNGIKCNGIKLLYKQWAQLPVIFTLEVGGSSVYVVCTLNIWLNILLYRKKRLLTQTSRMWKHAHKFMITKCASCIVITILRGHIIWIISGVFYFLCAVRNK